MIPRIFEVSEDKNRLKVTPECYTIPELKAIMDKFDMQAEPYLLYIYNHTHPEAPYINLSEDEKEENIVYDIVNTLGDFDTDDPLLQKAITKLKKLFTSTVQNYYEGLKFSMDNMAKYLRTTQILEGKDGNLSEIMRAQQNAGNTIRAFMDAQKQADDELKTKMKGNNEIGEY
jgi:hypothetical protein